MKTAISGAPTPTPRRLWTGVLSLAICAVLTGAKSFAEVAEGVSGTGRRLLAEAGDLKGAVVTTDAMRTNRSHAEYVHNHGPSCLD